MGHKETRHRCLVNGAAHSDSLLHLLASTASAFSAMSFPPSLLFLRAVGPGPVVRLLGSLCLPAPPSAHLLHQEKVAMG